MPDSSVSQSVASLENGAMDDLNVRTGADLGTQVWVGRNLGPDFDGAVSPALDPAKFKPVEAQEHAWWKPRDGGLWTAQWDVQHGGGWVQWCLSEQFECDRSDPTWEHVWLIEPEPDARVLVIDRYADLEHVYARWPHEVEFSSYRQGYPAWHLIAAEFDAVHVTEEGQWRTRLTHPLSLYGWDCESTLWLRWAFAETRDLGARTFTAQDPWWEDDDE